MTQPSCPRCQRLEALLRLCLKDGLRHDRCLWLEIHDTLNEPKPPAPAPKPPELPPVSVEDFYE